jgi:hypothetical protein
MLPSEPHLSPIAAGIRLLHIYRSPVRRRVLLLGCEMRGRHDEKYWRERAERVATSAAETPDQELKASLLALSKTYEYLARLAGPQRTAEQEASTGVSGANCDTKWIG